MIENLWEIVSAHAHGRSVVFELMMYSGVREKNSTAMVRPAQHRQAVLKNSLPCGIGSLSVTLRLSLRVKINQIYQSD